MKYNVMYYDSSDCCGAEEQGEGWECGKHSDWQVAQTCDTFEEAEAIGMSFSDWDIEEVDR